MFKVLALVLLMLQSYISLSQNEVKGFKSLFINNNFDSTKPYESQLDPRAINFTKEYIKKQGKELERMKLWGRSYFNLYDGILKQYNIPIQMKYLSVIESHLQHNLVSWAGAVGPWQIMDYEAKKYGLRVGKNDERMDYVKSTHVACKLMNELYNEFGDWVLVVAAYNGGAGRVRGAIKKSKSKDFWNLQPFLLEETRNHVKKFIATHYIFEGNSKLEITINAEEAKTDTSIHQQIDSITLNGRYVAEVICSFLRIDEKIFTQLNPSFNSTLASGKPYSLKLNKEKINEFIERKYEILELSLNKIMNK